jgi:hypothetical protein
MDLEAVLKDYTERKYISSDEVLDFISALDSELGFCTSGWVKKLIEISHKKPGDYNMHFYKSEKIEQRWQTEYNGNSSKFGEIVSEIRNEKRLLKRSVRRRCGKIPPKTTIFYHGLERVFSILADEEEFNRKINLVGRYLGINYTK